MMKKILDNFPKILGMASDFLHLAGLSLKTPEGKFGGLKPEAIRAHAPRMSKKAEHESRWTAVLAKINPNFRNAILLHFMANLHEEHQADLVQSVSDAVQVGPNAEQGVLEHLRHIANIPTGPRQQQQRVLYADSLNWIKRNPEDYWIVKLQNFTGRRFDNLSDLYAWVNNPAKPVITQLNARTAQIQANTANIRATGFDFDPARNPRRRWW